MRAAFRFTLAALFILALVPAAARAQLKTSGVTFGVGAGFGSADATCDDCGTSQRENSGAVYFKGGVHANAHVVIGAELNLWSKKFTDSQLDETAQITLYNVSGTVTVYPGSTGFFVKGGGGIAFMKYKLSGTNETVTFDLGRGPGVIVGAGYDIPAGRVVLTPAFNYWYGRLGDLKVGGQTALTNFRYNVYDITFGVGF